MNTAAMLEAARSFGADLAGVAPLTAFADAQPENDPRFIFPQAKSLIVLGRRVPRGSLRALDSANPAGRSFAHFGFMSLEDNYLAKTTYDLTVWIEARGHDAVPLFGYDTEQTAKYEVASPVGPGKPAPNVQVDWKKAAAAAGLGRVGRNGLFLTPEFGTRQRFALLLSDFAFEPVASSADAGMAEACADCRACVDACPMRALTDTARDDELCRKCRAGAMVTDFGRFHTVERIGAACGRACLASLEQRGRLTRPFNRPFREETAR